ncbi:hypothetical protein NIES4071_50110 [Calothrix sp. NIES-4071]|nr:hypothetical protein NIES4071_50110 [Calothrix sp. NIES-4071]BAZ59318.1 hypothetical protein NIES4105_50050 [Calothrix sp. NIES-4105]
MKPVLNNHFYALLNSEEAVLYSTTGCRKLKKAKSIVFIDNNISDKQSLIAGVKPDIEVVILDSTLDGVEQITESLQATRYNSVHIVSHGSPGCLYLGKSTVCLSTLDVYSNQLQQWFEKQELNELLLYGCNVAAGDAGEEFITKLHHLTGASVGASATPTGSAALGADWNLEITIGEIRPALAFEPELLKTYSYAFPSSNDDFANRIVLSGVSGTSFGNNVDATAEAGEASQSGINNSVWWSWTAPTNGTVTFDTIGSNFDTYLSVYTGNSVSSLTRVAFNDDIGSGNVASRVSFTVTAGTTYYIAVDGYSSNTGNVTLNYSFNSAGTTTTSNLAPILADTVVTLNSVSRDAGLPSGAVGTLVSSLVGIGRNVTDSNGAVTGVAIISADSSNGTWYYSTNNGTSWNTNGTLSSTNARLLAADSNTRLYFRPNANYTGSISNAITFRAWDQTSGVAGGLADASINGGSSAFSTATDTASITVSNPTPVNDNFANQITLVGTLGSITGTNIGATAETGEATQSGTNNSVWWSWTAPTNGTVTFDTIGSNFDTYLSVYTGTSVSSLALVVANDDSGGANTSRVSFNVTAGTVYRIAVDGYQAHTGNISLNYSLNSGGTTTTGNIAPTLTDTVLTLNPVNRDAALPSGAVGTLVSSLVGIGRNITDSNGAVTGVAIIFADSSNGTWYYSTNNGTSWNTNGSVSSTNARLLAADVNTRVYFRPNANYTGSISNAISFRAWDQTSGVAGGLADASINGGSTAFSTATDTASITVSNPTPVNDNFANQITLVGTLGSVTGTNIGATAETGEATQSGTNNSVWWSWTAPSNGTVTFDTIGSNFDTYLSVYTGTSVNSLTLVTFDDDGGGTNTSRVSFAVTAGTVYRIAVDGYSSNTGNISLNYSFNSNGTTTTGNLAPILTDTVVTLNSVNRDAALPSGAVGTLVSSLVGIGRNVTDSNGAVTGIAITGADTTNGIWYYSTNNGTSWNTNGTLSSTSARLLAADANTRVYFRPNANYTGSISNAITFRAWDQTSGVAGGVADTTINGGSTAFSTTTDVASIIVNSPSPINDNFVSRTVISGSSGRITGTTDGATGEVGELTQSGTTNSVWWSWTAPTNGAVTFDTIGSNFDTFLSVYTGDSINNLSLVRSDDNTGGNNASWTSFAVTAGTTYQIAVDGSNSNTGNVVLNYVLSSSGNRPPILTDTVVTLDAISQNAGTPSGAVGTLVSSLVALGRNVTDFDSGARTGIAVTNANTTNGSWWYSINNGENWFTLGDVYNDLARVLAADANTRIYFQPNANFTGTIDNAISFRAWDFRFAGDNGFRIAAANFSEQLSNFTETASITVNTSTNSSGSAPILADTVVTLNSVNEDAGAPSGAVGTLVSSIVGLGRNVTDSRSGAVTGIAISSVSTSNGTWWYSTNNGASWLQMGTLSNSNARLLAADTFTRVYFQANANYNGSISNAITFRAWNQTSGVNGSIANTTLNGGSTAFSSLADTASINVSAVNDAPVISPSYPLGIPTNATNGTIIGSLTATDIDSSNTVFSNWRIVGGNIDLDADGNMAFSINSNTGQIAVNDIDDLNPQVNPTVNLQVNVSDGVATSANENVVIKLALRPGELDPNFGISGIVTTPNTAYSRGVTVQPDGKIVVAGGFGSFDVARYNIDGTLDTSFGNSGRVNTDIGLGSETGYSVTLQSNGKIIVGGYVWNSEQPNYPDFALARYNVDGSLDSTFGNGGKVVTNFGEDFGRNVLVQSDGKIILAGYIGNGNPDYVLVRYNADGSLDTTFGSSGKVNGTNGHVAALQSDGKILVGGRVQIPNVAEFDFSLARYNNDGSLDTSFGNAGRSIVSIGVGEEIDSIAIQADGKIVVAGHVWRYVGGSSFNQDDLALARFNTDGSLDTNFGSGGKVITPLSTTNSDRANGLTIQPSGKIVVSGYFESGANRDRTSVLVAYNPDGSLDSSFGTGGQVITPIGSNYDVNRAVATQGDGNIVLVGQPKTSGGFTVARYIGTTDNNIGGTSGDDLIYGYWGNDKLDGYDGNDRIWGGDGNDEIWGGLGNDILNGGSGKDTFALVTNQGVDTIEDFQVGEDILGCAGGLRFTSLSFIQLQGDTLIRDTVSNQDLALLKGFTGSLNSNNFRTL